MVYRGIRSHSRDRHRFNGLIVFGIVNAVILRPFPYRNAERLLIAPISVRDFPDLTASADTGDLAIWASNLYPVRFGDDIEQVQGAIVSEHFFPMLGSAELGRPSQPRMFINQSSSSVSGSGGRASGRAPPPSARR